METAQLDELARIIRDVGTRFAQEAREQSQSGDDFTKREIMAISAVGGDGPLKIGDLATILGVGQSAITPLVDSLEQRGLLARQRSSEDRRIWLLVLTKNGEKAFGRIHDGYRAMAAAMLAPLDDDERAQLLSLFSRMA